MTANSVKNIAVLDAQDNKAALAWSKMLSNPSDFLERAPSQTPFLASKARFVRSFDIPYSETRDGNFAIAAIPSSQVCAAVSSADDQIVSVPAPLALLSLTPGSTDSGDSYLNNTFMRVLNNATQFEYGTMPFVDGSQIDPSLANIPGLLINAPAATVLAVDLIPSSQSQSGVYFRIGVHRTVANTIQYSSAVAINAAPTNFTVADDSDFLFIQLCTSTGVAVAHREDLKLNISVTSTANMTTGVFATSASFNLLKSEVLEAGKLGNHRCTAMSMLVTNMAPPLISGGELVAARCPFSVVNSGNPATIMTTIKQLPEERYWRSGAIKDGSYAWWLPDDLQSYEPTPYPEASQPENILVAAGKMSDPGGFVRVLITYIFEFYTPVQLFSRDYNFTYNQMVHTLWNRLSLSPAVSPNAGHLALINSAIALASTVYSFYQQHRELIDPAMKAAYGLARSEFAKMQRPRQAKKQDKKQVPKTPAAQKGTGKTSGTGVVVPKK